MLSDFRPTRRSLWLAGLIGVFSLATLGLDGAHAAASAPSYRTDNGAPQANSAASQPGFWKQQGAVTGNPALTAGQIAQFLPKQRGPFQFPAPYSTTGIRVTLPSDCGGQNCIHYVGYSYFATMSNSTGLSHMWIMAASAANKGGTGPTLYKLDKSTNEVTNLGPIFNDSRASLSGEMMYFSHSLPNALYYMGDNKTTLNHIDVVTHKTTRVFDIEDYKPNHHIYACTSSHDDMTHVCTFENANWDRIGCIVYHSDTGNFQEFAAMTSSGVHSCAMGPGGTYIYITEQTQCPTCSSDTVIADLSSGKQTIIRDKDGGSGHHALGYGYVLINDNYDPGFGATKLWKVSDLSQPVGHVWAQPWETMCLHSGSNEPDCAATTGHPSWINAVPPSVKPISEQYACNSTANAENVAFANQVFCYYLDTAIAPTQLKALVIAPTMSNADKTGCGSLYYDNEPKGNIDPTGHYFMWSANLDSNDNCQVFLVEIPIAGHAQPPPPDTAAPTINITNPANAASVTGTVMVKAKVSSDLKISNVTWKVDTQNVGSSSTAPYAYELNTDNFALGYHELHAVATDMDGNTGADTNTITIVQGAPSDQPPEQQPGSGPSGGGGSLSWALLAALGLLTTLVAVRRSGYAQRQQLRNPLP